MTALLATLDAVLWGCLRSSFMLPLHNSQRGGVKHVSAGRISYRSISVP
jgi:hypothetical protein